MVNNRNWLPEEWCANTLWNIEQYGKWAHQDKPACHSFDFCFETTLNGNSHTTLLQTHKNNVSFVFIILFPNIYIYVNFPWHLKHQTSVFVIKNQQQKQGPTRYRPSAQSTGWATNPHEEFKMRKTTLKCCAWNA